jgi:CHAT domain-containing protein
MALATRNYREAARSVSRGLGLAALPAVEREANSIRTLYGADRTLWLRNEQANEANVKAQNLTDFRILHFASHAVLPSELGWLSEAALILGNTGPQDPEDGLLMAGEVEKLRFHADLVVLSACDTAGGKFVQGSGFLGLSSSFLTAGAKSLLVSQWKVSDDATALLMEKFHQGLKAGNGPAKALREAKLWLRTQKQAGNGHPFFWAPFVLVGAPG